jgi:hypothetical protein
VCDSFGTRVCTSADLQSDVGYGLGCDERVWTSTPCGDGKFVSQGATSSSLMLQSRQCSPTDSSLPFICCSDFKNGMEFSNYAVSVQKKSATLEFDWPAYASVEVAFRIVGAKTFQAKNVQRVALLEGHAQAELLGLSGGKNYEVRITPVALKSPVLTQAMTFSIETPRF